MSTIDLPDAQGVQAVVLPDPSRAVVVVEGREAEIIAWLAIFADDVRRVDYGTLTFELAAGQIVPKLQRSYDRVRVTRAAKNGEASDT